MHFLVILSFPFIRYDMLCPFTFSYSPSSIPPIRIWMWVDSDFQQACQLALEREFLYLYAKPYRRKWQQKQHTRQMRWSTELDEIEEGMWAINTREHASHPPFARSCTAIEDMNRRIENQRNSRNCSNAYGESHDREWRTPRSNVWNAKYDATMWRRYPMQQIPIPSTPVLLCRWTQWNEDENECECPCTMLRPQCRRSSKKQKCNVAQICP